MENKDEATRTRHEQYCEKRLQHHNLAFASLVRSSGMAEEYTGILQRDCHFLLQPSSET